MASSSYIKQCYEYRRKLYEKLKSEYEIPNKLIYSKYVSLKRTYDANKSAWETQITTRVERLQKILDSINKLRQHVDNCSSVIEGSDFSIDYSKLLEDSGLFDEDSVSTASSNIKSKQESINSLKEDLQDLRSLCTNKSAFCSGTIDDLNALKNLINENIQLLEEAYSAQSEARDADEICFKKTDETYYWYPTPKVKSNDPLTVEEWWNYVPYTVS